MSRLEEIEKSHPRQERDSFFKVSLLFYGLIFLALGIWLSSCGLEVVEKNRQLQRLVELPLASVAYGEVRIAGRIEALEPAEPLRTPVSGHPVVYYRHTIEERRSSSDGDSWHEIKDQRGAVDFRLVDETGAVLVVIDDNEVFRGAPIRKEERQGDRRIRERWFEAGDEVHVFGFAARNEETGVVEVGFQREGAYYPSIGPSSHEERQGPRALGSTFLVWLGSSALLIAVVILLILSGRTRPPLFTAALMGALLLIFGLQGTQVLKRDLEASHASALKGTDAVRELLEEEFAPLNLEWSGDFADLDEALLEQLDEKTRQRVEYLYLGLFARNQSVRSEMSRFPEALLARMLGFPMLEELPPMGSESGLVRELEIAGGEASKEGVVHPFFTGLALLLALLGIRSAMRLGLRELRFLTASESLPTTPIGGVSVGLTEISGRARAVDSDQMLLAPVSKIPCLLYRYQFEEQGESNWITRKDEQIGVPFLCSDSSGAIKVFPSKALTDLMHKRITAGEKPRTREIEWIAVEGTPLYILGTAQIDKSTKDRLEIRQDEGDSTPYRISSFPEEIVDRDHRELACAAFTAAIISTLLGALFVSVTFFPAGPVIFWLALLCSFFHLIIILILFYYNNLIFLRERVRRSEANVRVGEEKKKDLLENLKRVVEGAREQERVLQTGVQARGAELLVEEIPAIGTDNLQVVMEEEIRAIENELAILREGLANDYERFQTLRSHFPEVLIAKLGRIKVGS